MSDLPEVYVQRMGYMPCYKFPEEIDEDDTFVYYMFRVPRHYIREHIAEGLTWPDYKEIDEQGTEDKSIVLGVGFFPVYTGVIFLYEDVDFLYYKVRVPKKILDATISGTSYTYRILYETKDFRLKSAEEKAEEESRDISCVKAGEEMPDRKNLTAVRKTKEIDTLLYEVVFYCAECDTEHDPEVGTDLWGLLHARKCRCGNTKLELRRCESVLEEKRDDS